MSCEAIDPISFGVLNRLFLDTPELHMVCSTTWRTGGREHIEQSLKQAHAALIRATNMPEIPYAIRFHDIAGEPESWRTEPSVGADIPRGNWLDQYLNRYCDEHQKYIILDDDPDFKKHHMPFLVQTDGYRGFGVREYIQIQDMIKSFGNDPAPYPAKNDADKPNL